MNAFGELDFRTNPLTGREVVIAPGRAQRPYEFGRQPVERPAQTCPFCRGLESHTPPAFQVWGTEKDWQVRAVPNRYPAVANHEVIIESPSHHTSLSQLDGTQAALVFEAYRQRLLSASGHPEIAIAQVFKNSGANAGASIEHIHSQLMTLPTVPGAIASQLSRLDGYWRKTGGCLLCELAAEERAGQVRVVADEDNVIAFCPHASFVPYETWLVPCEHQPAFEHTDAATLKTTAALTKRIIARLERIVDTPSYNYVIVSAPFRCEGREPVDRERFHWRLEILPRITSHAGFELSTGCYVNAVSPEEAAGRLRAD